MRSNLLKPETLITVGDYSVTQVETMMIPCVESIKKYVGAIEIPGIAMGTVCLLENGTILTCLHNILDYNKLSKGKAELIDFSKYDVSVYFVKDGDIYKYKIKETLDSGLDTLKNQGMHAMCFDYALLGANGDPVRDLGGGFKPDQTDYFSSLLASDPASTVAISGPFVTKTDKGIQFHRFISLANNKAAESKLYHITQSGNHPSAPGFSGMAIVPATERNNTLYAIHSYRDNQGQQNGTKISEIRSAMRTSVAADADYQLNREVYDILTSWHEVLTQAERKMDGTIKRGAQITFEEAVAILKGRGDIAGDSRKEVEGPAKSAWGAFGKLIRHDVHSGTPKGQPHFHHPLHTDTAYPGHAFYPSASQQTEKLKKEYTPSAQKKPSGSATAVKAVAAASKTFAAKEK